MAYGNWGAFVYKNGKRRPDREDQTPFSEKKYTAGYMQAFLRTDDNEIDPHHAVLGDGPIRLCGYKCNPRLFLSKCGKKEEVNLNDYGVSGTENHPWTSADGTYYPEFQRFEGEIKFDGGIYLFSCNKENNTVILDLLQPDGSSWTSLCGLKVGAGHQEPEDMGMTKFNFFKSLVWLPVNEKNNEK